MGAPHTVHKARAYLPSERGIKDSDAASLSGVTQKQARAGHRPGRGQAFSKVLSVVTKGSVGQPVVGL